MSYNTSCSNYNRYVQPTTYTSSGQQCNCMQCFRPRTRSRSRSRSKSRSRSRSASRSRYRYSGFLPPYVANSTVAKTAPKPANAEFKVLPDIANDKAIAPTPSQGAIQTIVNGILSWFSSGNSNPQYVPNMDLYLNQSLNDMMNWYQTEFLTNQMQQKVGVGNTINFLLALRQMSPDAAFRRTLNDKLISNFLAFDQLYTTKPEETEKMFGGRLNVLGLYKLMKQFLMNVVQPNDNLIIYMTQKSDSASARQDLEKMIDRINQYVMYT